MEIHKFIEMMPDLRLEEKLMLLKMMKEDISTPAEDKKLFYDKLDNDTAYFARVFLGHIVRKVPDFHRDIYDAMNGLDKDPEQQYFGGIMFRSSAKSTIKNIYAIKVACHQRHPVIYMVSETERQAIGDLRSIADEFESNELIKYFYFDGKKPKGSIWNAGYIEISNGVAIISAGFSSAHRGFKHKNQRPTLVILDDFESKNNLATEELRMLGKDIIENVIIPMGDTNAKFVFLNTIVSPLSYMQGQYELWQEGKGLFASPQGKLVKKELTTFLEDGTEIATWPEEKPLSWVKKKKQMFIDSNNLAGWWQEYYNVPKEESDPKFNTDLITETNGAFVGRKYCKFIQIGDKKIPVNTFLGVDPAVRLNTTNDDTCIFTLAMDRNSNIYIINIYAGKIEEIKKPILIIGDCRKYKVDFGVIETYGYQFSLMEWTKKFMSDTNEFYCLQEFSNGISKKQKYLEGLETPINSGKVSYLKGCPHVDLMKRQMNKFSGGKRTHDDIIDGFFLAAWRAYPCTLDESTCERLIEKELSEDLGKKQASNYLDWRVA